MTGYKTQCPHKKWDRATLRLAPCNTQARISNNCFPVWSRHLMHEVKMTGYKMRCTQRKGICLTVMAVPLFFSVYLLIFLNLDFINKQNSQTQQVLIVMFSNIYKVQFSKWYCDLLGQMSYRFLPMLDVFSTGALVVQGRLVLHQWHSDSTSINVIFQTILLAIDKSLIAIQLIKSRPPVLGFVFFVLIFITQPKKRL